MIERPFPCYICGKKYRRLQHLRDHIFIHRKMNPHNCGLYWKGFCQKKNLKVHCEAVAPGKDGLVRSCKVGYEIPRETRDITKYKGRRWVTITCSVQRLSLLLAVEEQEKPLAVEGGEVIPKASAENELGSEAIVEINFADKTGDKVSTVMKISITTER